ncbi:MAG: Na+:solute symporter [Planctomycetes bacterium]|nr:Na+:solute symporter [Planctomycetota bacterium]
MRLEAVDWISVIAFFAISLLVGIIVAKKAGKSSSDFFLSGRSMPWWLLGVSMVATTFSTDTPNLVSDIVRQNGVSGNWVWWAFLLTGMLTVFVYAKLWRRSGVMTDVEFYELRYSGKTAAFLRGFRALYLGVFFNIVVMASVTLAAIKIGSVMLDLKPWQTVSIAAIVTVAYSMLGGLKGVLITDFLQFGIAMFGAVMAAVIAVKHPAVNGLSGLLTHANVVDKLNFFPDFSNKDILMAVFVIPLAVQWWSVWYPGSEPGGGGYLVQRMLAAKDEKNALGATLFFNVAHYALRPWPWIIVALCSLIVFPDLESLRAAFPNVNPDIVKHDMAYPAMLTYLPHGLLGLVVASLIAAYMSTISTHLNWGSSYIVNDYYKRFIRPDATEKQLVRVGRISTLLLMVATCILATFLENSMQVFNLILQIGAGTGLIFILRWFWWRINAFSEITAMIVSFVVACYFNLIHDKIGPPLENWEKLLLGIAITTFAWILVTFLTKPTDKKTLYKFCNLVHAGGPGWNVIKKLAKEDGVNIEKSGEKWDMPYGILCMVLGCVFVYASLFATGLWIYGESTKAIMLTILSAVSVVLLLKFWGKLNLE